MNDSRMVAALEIGTSKIQVFLGEIIDNKSMSIVGMGQQASLGIKKGDIYDLKKASQIAHEAIVSAENATNIRTKSVYMSISGAHIKGMRSIGSANVRGENNIVTTADIERAKEDAQNKTLDSNSAFIHKICCGYYLDGKFSIDPLGKEASRIDAEYWLVYGDSEKISNALHIVHSFGMVVEEIIFSGIASARMVTTQQQRKDGILVVDIGCGTTDYVLYKNGRPIISGVIPIGGDHITNDLAHGLRMYNKNAETIKRKLAKAIITEDERNEFVWTKGDQQIGDKKISIDSLNKIVRSRVEELFLIMRQDIGDFLDSSIENMVLTGGTSRLKAINELAQGVMGIPCHSGKFNSWVKHSLCNPEYATVLGLLDYALEDSAKKTSSRFFDKLNKFLKSK